MTAGSIASDSATNYAEYLDAKATPGERGDYYLGRDGLPAEAPGRWHGPARILAFLGIQDAAPVERAALEALMEGRHPTSTREAPKWLRAAGADGTRAAGIDVTFSAPKSVSIAWALTTTARRDDIEAAHRGAVADALAHLQQTVPTIAVYQGRGLPHLEVPAAGLLTAEFLHTTARGVGDSVPDPQLHSHCVVTSAVRADATIAAVRSRPVFRSAREVGAYYRAALAWRLSELGYEIEHSTGNHGRYFELAGVPADARAAFSKRSREVHRAAERFRAEYGRAPQRGELRTLKIASRQAKQPRTRGELQAAWQATADAHHITAPTPTPGLAGPAPSSIDDRSAWAHDVEGALTRTRATFSVSELRATALEQAPGRLPAASSLRLTAVLTGRGSVLALENGALTTAAVRDQEHRTLDAISRLAQTRHPGVTERDRAAAAAEVQARLGSPMSAEQQHALGVLTGPARAAVLIGPAGTGKGVVIDAVARAEQTAGRTVVGIAVAGSTAERLGHDSPALQGATLTVDALLARTATGQHALDAQTTVIFDEAGMADTARLDRLVTAVEAARSKLVIVGDAHQLASIGPGGLFQRAAQIAPTAELTDVLRTRDPAEQQAWNHLRAGRPDLAMAHYRQRGQLHLADTRDDALEAAVQRYDQLALRHGSAQVALMTDGPNVEVHRMNARAQQLRAERGELGDQQLELGSVPYSLRAGDRIALIAAHPVPDGPRVENGTRGDIIGIDPRNRRVRIRLDTTHRVVDVDGDVTENLRLAYAQHLYRQQGATVDRAVTLTGGWQTTREGSYVQASRARQGTDWHVSRDELGTDADDTQRLDRLADAMTVSGAQIPSLDSKLRVDASPADRVAFGDLNVPAKRRAGVPDAPSIDRGR